MRLTDSILNGFQSIFGGKDSYTQTNFQNMARFIGLAKGEYKIDTSIGGLHEIATTTAHLSAVINRKANMMANGRWREYKLVNGKKELVYNSEAVFRLENPNPLQNGNEFIRQLSWSYDTYGSGLSNLNRVNSPIPQSMYVLPTAELIIKRTGKIYKQVELKEIIERIYMTSENGDVNFELDDLVIFKNSNPNDPVLGISPIEMLKLPIANIRAGLGFRNRIINNDAALGILSGVATQDMSVGLKVKDQERIQAGYKSKYGMQQGKKDLIISETPVSWTAMSYPTKDLMLFEEITQDFKIIIDFYGLNENIFSRDKASTFSNYTEGLRSAYQDCIIPQGQDMALSFTKAFKMDGVTNWLEYDFSHLDILKENEKEKSENTKRDAESAAILRANGYEDVANSIVDRILPE
jgi:phage portal protein BeeE